MKLKLQKTLLIFFIIALFTACIDNSDSSVPTDEYLNELIKAYDHDVLDAMIESLISIDENEAFENLPFDLYRAGLVDKPGFTKLFHSSSKVRTIIAKSLQFSHNNVTDDLMGLLYDYSIDVRQAALNCLALRGEKEGLEKLLALALSKDDPNSNIAVDSLFQVREMWILRPLHKYLLDNWDSIYLSEKYIKLVMVFRKLAGWYYYEKANLSFYSMIVKNRISLKDIQTLGIMGTSSSVPSLIHIINSENQYRKPTPIFLSALEVLVVIPKPQAVAFLISKIKDNKTGEIKIGYYKKAIENSYRYHAYIIEHMDEKTAKESLQIAGLYRHTAFRKSMLNIVNKRMERKDTSAQIKSIIRNVNKQLNEK
ncbi:MAG: HEAT repeat domain-containing protein [Acidobacteria bacterium]|nr:HEAT repeat domain-containing protein [Acidobacteriota bacterium]